MNERERTALEAAGFRIGDAEDFLGLTDEERHLVELRVAVSRAVRARREEQGLTQEQVARKLKTSQPRVAVIEAGAAAVSLDSMFRALFALGGSVRDLLVACSVPPARQAVETPRHFVASINPPSASAVTFECIAPSGAYKTAVAQYTPGLLAGMTPFDGYVITNPQQVFVNVSLGDASARPPRIFEEEAA